MMDISSTQPHIIHWDYFKNYHKHCDQIAMRGATYAFVFNETKPKEYQQPFEFEECVYIGKSAGSYVDKQSGSRSKLRSNLHKRMTTHHKALMTGKTDNISSYKSIIENYGYGDNVMDGTLTGIPMWLCIMLPRPDVPDELVARWALMQEQLQMYFYESKFGRPTIGNMDTKTKRSEYSFSNYRMDSIKNTSLERHMND